MIVTCTKNTIHVALVTLQGHCFTYNVNMRQYVKLKHVILKGLVHLQDIQIRYMHLQ